MAFFLKKNKQILSDTCKESSINRNGNAREKSFNHREEKNNNHMDNTLKESCVDSRIKCMDRGICN